MNVRWGIAGCGWVARDYVAPALAASMNGSLTALFDLSPDAVAQVATQFPQATVYPDLAALLANVDALYVATPNNAHLPVVRQAAAARVPILCEKPMAATLVDARSIVQVCRAAGVRYATAFDQRFHPAHQHLAALIGAGALGTVTALRIVYCCWVGPSFAGDNWRIDPARAGGGALMDLAPHGLDLASYLLGDRIVEVAAMGQTRVHDYPVEDGALVIGRTADGILVQAHVAYNCPETLPRRRLEVVGTRGQVVAIDTMGQTPGGHLTYTDAATGTETAVYVPDADRSPFLNQAEAFAACVADGGAFPFTPEHDLHIMTLVDQAQALVDSQLRSPLPMRTTRA